MTEPQRELRITVFVDGVRVASYLAPWVPRQGDTLRVMQPRGRPAIEAHVESVMWTIGSEVSVSVYGRPAKAARPETRAG